ncbi:MAG: YkgJ family cysteine cluster protein [Deltaproteobacteria bacterium]|nr:YkgJ family cysteine cluster protein [Deltaproteobacteria bacterium]
MNSIEEAIANLKSTELSAFCLGECKKSCCLFEGLSIAVNEEQLKFLYGPQVEAAALYGVAAKMGCGKKVYAYLFRKLVDKLDKGGSLKKEGDRYRLQNTACPQYDEKTKACRVHDDPKRPPVCETFPISYRDGTGVILDARCSYVYQHWEDIILSLTMTLREKTISFKVIAPFIIGIFPYDANDYRKMRNDAPLFTMSSYLDP